MKQSTIIFGVIIFLFVVYITMRGDLPKWFELFHMEGPHDVYQPAPQTAEAGGGSGGGGVGKVAGGVLGGLGLSTTGLIKKGATMLGNAIMPGLGTVGVKVGSLLSKIF